jgi:hypothetical protein
MKTLYPVLILFLSGCIVRDPIEMKQTSLRLTGMQKFQTQDESNLKLEWESLDGNIRIVTKEPISDSSLYEVGVVYTRCFIPR